MPPADRRASIAPGLSRASQPHRASWGACICPISSGRHHRHNSNGHPLNAETLAGRCRWVIEGNHRHQLICQGLFCSHIDELEAAITYLNSVIDCPAPQSDPLPGMAANSAGGHAYPVDDLTRLDRFLVLVSKGGSYYASERKLTLEYAQPSAAASRPTASGPCGKSLPSGRSAAGAHGGPGPVRPGAGRVPR